MGASVSKTSVDIVNEAIVEAIVETALSSQAAIDAEQTTIISGSKVRDSTISQSAKLSLQSLQEVKVDNELINKMETKIRQAAEANSVILSAAVATSSTNMKNILSTKVGTSTILKAVAAVSLKQKTIIENSEVTNTNVSQTADLFSKAMQTALNNNKVAQAIVNDVDQKASSTTSFLGSWGMYVIIAIIAIIVLGVGAYFMFSGQDIEIIGLPSPGQQTLGQQTL
jgi:hypothetical protein